MSIRIRCPEGHSVVVAASKLGSEVACPHCLAFFCADTNLDMARHARAEKGKARPARDDDDDEDEGEKPAKKSKPVKAKKSDDEKASKKAKPDKAKKKDEEEEEEEDDKDQPEPEAPIEWTPRKRQLKVVSFGLMVMQAGFYIMVAFTVFAVLSIGYYETLEDYKKPDAWSASIARYIFYFVAVPLLYVAIAAFMGCMVVSFFKVPAKAEAGAGLLATLVFGGLIFLLAVLLILTLTEVIVQHDGVREVNMWWLLAGGSMLCFVICLMSTMGYLARLFVFMNMHMEATQPITNGAFVLMVYAGMLILVKLVSTAAKDFIGGAMGIAIAILAAGLAGYGIFLLVSHVKLIQVLRNRISAYIRDE